MNKSYMHNPESIQENDTLKILRDFETQMDTLISARWQEKQKKRTCQIVDIAGPADNRVKLKESEKRDKNLDLARELKKLWNMKMMVIPVVIGALGTVIKRLVQGQEGLEIREQEETIQTTALFCSVRILRRV